MGKKKVYMKVVEIFMLLTLLLPTFIDVTQVYAESQELDSSQNETNALKVSEVGSTDTKTAETEFKETTSEKTVNQTNYSSEDTITVEKKQELHLTWILNDLTETKNQISNFDQAYWKGTLQVKGKDTDKVNDTETFVIDMGEDFRGVLSSQNERTTVKKIEKNGQWEVTYTVSNEEETFETLIDVVIEKEQVKDQFDKQKQLSLKEIQVMYAEPVDYDEKVSLLLTDVAEEVNTSVTQETETVNTNDSKKEEPLSKAAPLDSLMKPNNKMVANLFVSEVFSKNPPLSGEYFDMTVRVNSGSIGDSEEPIAGLKTVVMLEDTLEIVSLPSNNYYQVSQEKVGNQNKITVTYLKDLPAGKNLSIPFGLRFKKGISLPTTSLEGSIMVTATNANSKEKSFSEIHPENTDRLSNYLKPETDPEAEATEAHTTQLKIASEGELGGLNIKNGKLVLEFPDEIELYSVVYDGVNYPVQGPKDGVYTVEIMIGDINVGSEIGAIDITYEYPFSGTGLEKEYMIKATLTGDRLNGEAINEKITIPETVPPAGNDLSNYPGIKFFNKLAPSKVIRSSDQSLAYTINFTPKLDMRDVSLVDDPIRNTPESDFFEGFSYETISWSAQQSKNPSLSSLIYTEVFYQTNKNTSWRSASGPQAAGVINISSLGLGEEELITNIKYVFSYDGKSFIPKDAGKVSISGVGKTLEGINDSSSSLEDGITNTLHIYGDRKFPNQPDSSYESFVAGGYEANQDDENNTKTATTTYKGAGAYPGYIGWESPFSPSVNNIGESFTYQIGVNNALGSGVLKDPILYVTVPKSIVIEKIELMNPQYDPNVEIEVRQVNDENQLVIIKYNDDWDPMEYWNYNHGIRIQAYGSKNVKGQEIFNNYLVSGNDDQTYDGGAFNENIPGIGVKKAATSKWRVVKFNRSIGLGSKKEISTDGINFSRWTNLINDDAGKDVIFRLTVPNDGEVDIDELYVIDQLPHVSDSMAISADSKNSSIGGQLKSITLSDGTSLDLINYELYYSTDATAEANQKELAESSNNHSTWTIWDGQTHLDTEVVAIKIIKKNGLVKEQEVSFNLNYHIPKTDKEIGTIWNSFAVGGKYIDGTTQVNLEVGEPIKSGAYVSQQVPTKKIAGVVWKDENGNGIREETESLLKDIEVNLYDWNNDLVTTTKTKADGSYEFTDLYNAKYRVIVKRNNSTYTLIDYQKGSNKEIDNDFLEVDSEPEFGEAQVDLTTETNPLNIDAGYIEQTSIDGHVWYDSNYDGLQTPGESPASNIEVSLYKVDGNSIGNELIYVKSATTSSNGKYYFTGTDIKPGKYVIQTNLPTNYTVTTKGNLTDTNNSKFNPDGKTDIFTAKSGSNSFWDLGLINRIPNYITITGKKIWKDNQDKQKERSSAIKVQLYQEGIVYGEPITVLGTSSDTWAFSFKDIPEFDASGKKYSYTIKEVGIPENYESVVDNEKYTITNTYTESITSTTTEPTSSTTTSSSNTTTEPTSSSSTSSSSTTTDSTNNSPISSNSSGQYTKKQTNDKRKLPTTGEKEHHYSITGMLFILFILLILFRNYVESLFKR